MIHPAPVTLEGHGIRLEPLAREHREALVAAISDGNLWELWFTTVPRPEDTAAYIERALTTSDRIPWVVRELGSGEIIGTTSFHDIVREIDRVEIGFTFYAARFQGTHVNTACKLLLFTYAFETLRCAVVGFRTDGFNFRSQRAIEGLGAKKDGVIRHHARRKDGTARDTVIYSVLAAEWPDVKRNLELRLKRRR